VHPPRPPVGAHLHPPSSGHGVGGGDKLGQLQRQRSPSYKEVLLCQSSAHHQEGSKEGWQVVKCKRSKLCTSPQVSETRRQQQRHSLYLKRMKGLCFNYLARDHKVSSCQSPTRCWHCCQFEHTSGKCILSSSEHPFSVAVVI
jgi:hypothetical protein